jgi:hypothetical protein
MFVGEMAFARRSNSSSFGWHSLDDHFLHCLFARSANCHLGSEGVCVCDDKDLFIAPEEHRGGGGSQSKLFGPRRQFVQMQGVVACEVLSQQWSAETSLTFGCVCGCRHSGIGSCIAIRTKRAGSGATCVGRDAGRGATGVGKCTRCMGGEV